MKMQVEEVKPGPPPAPITPRAEDAAATAIVTATVDESAVLWGSDGRKADSYDSQCAPRSCSTAPIVITSGGSHSS